MIMGILRRLRRLIRDHTRDTGYTRADCPLIVVHCIRFFTYHWSIYPRGGVVVNLHVVIRSNSVFFESKGSSVRYFMFHKGLATAKISS